MLQNLGFLDETQSSVFRVSDEIERTKRYLDSTKFAVDLRGDNYSPGGGRRVSGRAPQQRRDMQVATQR